MRIAFLLVKHPIRGGGIETFTYHASRRLVQRGHQVTVYSMGHYGEIQEEMDGVRVVSVPSLRGSSTERLSGSAIAMLRAAMGSQRFDVIHCHTPMTGAFAVLPRLLGIPAVLQLHGIDWMRARWGFVARNTILLTERVAFPIASAITAVSREQCEFYQARYGRPVQYIPTGAEFPTRATSAEELHSLGLEKNRYLLFLARLVPEKGVHYLIPAYRRLKTDLPLVIAGNGDQAYEASLRKLAEGDPRIRFLGYVDGERKNQLLTHARLFVQTSDLEGLSISLLEAMSYGLCCLASDLPANQEALGDTGVYFRKSDEDDLVTQLAGILDNPAKMDALGSAANTRVMSDFSWEQVTSELERLYTSVAAKHEAPSSASRIASES